MGRFEPDAGLLNPLEARLFRANGVSARQEKLHQVAARGVGDGLGRRVPLQIGDGDGGARDRGSAGIGHLAPDAGAKFLSADRSGQKKKTSSRAKEVHGCLPLTVSNTLSI